MGMALPAAILGGSGLLGGLYSAKVAQENNEDQIDFAHWSQLNSQEFNAAMYDKAIKDQREMYEKYQSPQAIAQSLRAAGLNPSAMNGSLQGGSIPSVPSTPNSSPVATPQLQNEGSAFAQSLQSIGSAFSSLASAELQDAQTNESRSLLNEKLNQLILQNNGQQLMNAKTQFDTYAAQKKLPYEINELINDCYLKYYQGKHSEALSSLVEVQEKIASKEFDIKSEEAATIGMMLQKQLGLLDENIRLTQAKQATEKSAQSSNYASASLSREQAKTVHDIRADVVRFNKSLANIKDTEDFVSSNTAWNQVQQSLYELNAAKLIPSQIQEAINHARKANDWYEVNELLGIVDEGVKAYGTYYGAKTGKGFVDAQDVRNSIDKDFKDWQKNKANNGSRTYTPRSPYDYIGR